MVLKIECAGCQHVANFMASDVAQFCDPARSLEALPFRCSSCDTKAFTVIPMELDRDRRSSIVVWRPMRVK